MEGVGVFVFLHYMTVSVSGVSFSAVITYALNAKHSVNP